MLFKCLVVFACCGAPAARAQSSEYGVGELSGFAGGVAGLGAHPAGGLGFAVATSERTVVAGAIGFAPLSDKALPDGARGVLRSRLYMFSVTGQIRFPISPYLAPYVLAGPGLLRITSRLDTGRTAGEFSYSAAENTFGLVTGGGVRYYLNDKWGLRPELRVFAGRRVLAGLSLGIFYQFP